MKGQMHFAMIAIGLVVAVIGLAIAATVASQSAGNFTGISGTVFTYIIPLAVLGLLVYIAYAAFGHR